MQPCPLVNVRHFACLKCKHLWDVEPYFGDAAKRNAPYAAGPWYCNRCGEGHRFEFRPDGTMSAELYGGTEYPTMVVLELPPQQHSIYLRVDRSRVKDRPGQPNESADERDQHDRYVYEEHTCPTNWFRDVGEIMCNGDTDPHRLFKYVGTVERAASTDPNDAELPALLMELNAAPPTVEIDGPCHWCERSAVKVVSAQGKQWPACSVHAENVPVGED